MEFTGKYLIPVFNILERLGEVFDVTPFVNRRCKTPIEEIQAADGAVSPKQAVKLRQCLKHIASNNFT